MTDGWWTSFALTGSWFCFGLLVYMFRREKERKKALQDLEKALKNADPDKSVELNQPSKELSVKELEDYFRKKG